MSNVVILGYAHNRFLTYGARVFGHDHLCLNILAWNAAKFKGHFH